MTDEEIPHIPRIPEPLRVSAKRGIVVPFIGAGVSQICGCPGWDAFANAALRFFVRPGELDHSQFDQLAHLSPRVKISIAVGLEQQFRREIDFKSILEVQNPSSKQKGERIYADLGRLARTFITTNYDDWLDKPIAAATQLPIPSGGNSANPQSPKRNVFCRAGDFTEHVLSSPYNVIHIHGSASDRRSMILTTSEYLSRYASHRVSGPLPEENQYLAFLEYLFRTKSVLFIGYGLSELEILEFIVQKARGINPTGSIPASAQEEPRHYLVQGFFSHELAVMRSLREYYLHECRIELLPFCKDRNGWDQLIDIVEYLAKEIPVHDELQIQALQDMEQLLT
jgi:hypothetical protein